MQFSTLKTFEEPDARLPGDRLILDDCNGVPMVSIAPVGVLVPGVTKTLVDGMLLQSSTQSSANTAQFAHTFPAPSLALI